MDKRLKGSTLVNHVLKDLSKIYAPTKNRPDPTTDTHTNEKGKEKKKTDPKNNKLSKP